MSVKCPECSAPLSLLAVVAPESRMRFVLHPKSGQMMTAETVGGTLVQLSKLIKAAGRDTGGNVEVFVSGFKSRKGGALEYELITLEIKRAKP